MKYEYLHKRKPLFPEKYHDPSFKKASSNLKHYHYYQNTNNYHALIDEDNFIPIKAKSPKTISYLSRKPTVNTTNITYIENNSYDNIINADSFRRRTNFHKKSKSYSASEIVHPHLSQWKKLSKSSYKEEEFLEDPEMDIIYTKQPSNYNGYHLQKVLKIKEKLRQKLKRKSERKE